MKHINGYNNKWPLIRNSEEVATFHLVGGLANQLIQFGAARVAFSGHFTLCLCRAADSLGIEIYSDVLNQMGIRLVANCEPTARSQHFIAQAIANRVRRPQWLRDMSKRVLQDNLGDVEPPEIASTRRYLWGYFQEEVWFESMKEVLRELVARTPGEYLPEVTGGNYGAVHIRANAEHSGGCGAIRPSYYLDGLVWASSQVKEAYLLTDSPEYVEKISANFQTSPHGLKEHPIKDFLLLMNASKLVISNSTFSWLAGFLSTSSDVTAPSCWWHFRESYYYPESWKKAERSCCPLVAD